MDGPERGPRNGPLGIGRQPGDPEVGDHRPPVAREQDVAGLHVAMDDPADMRDAERAGDVKGDPGRFAGRKAADPPQARSEVLALDQLHDQERLSVIGAGLETGNDVRVAEDGGRQRFAPETHRDVGVLDDLATEELHRDRATEFRVERPMDRRHPADADDLGKQVAFRDQPPDVRGGCGGVARLGHAATIVQVRRIGCR